MSKRDLLELDIPEGVSEAELSVELVRAWIADGALRVTLNADAFGDHVADWGRMLGEIAEHIAKASALQGFMSEREATVVLREAFNAAASGVPTEGQARTAEGKMPGRTRH
ncbi:MAG: DUF5076 domain-containing protein [Hyphomicrobium sp.]